MSWRLGFAGAPAFAAAVLGRLVASRHRVELVYTQPDRPAGRGRKLAPSAVRALAEAAGIEVRTPTRLRGETAALAKLDCLVVAAYGLLLPEPVLEAPRQGCLNVHASLLPRWRGAAPVERAILAGDAETGVSIMQIDAGLDTGPVYQQRRLPLDADATGPATTDALAKLGADTLLDVLDALPELAPVPQDDRLATYASKLTADDAKIDWRKDATAIDRQVRALSGRMAAHTSLQGGVRMRILQARPTIADADAPPGMLQCHADGWRIVCGRGALELATVQLNRGKGTAMPIANAVNGFRRVLFDGAHCAEAEQ